MEQAKKTGNKRISLRLKYTLFFVSLFVLLIAALCLINSLLLQKYYLEKQLDRVDNTREMLEDLARDRDNEELRMQLTRQCESSGIAAVLAWEDDVLGSPVMLFSSGDDRGLWRISAPSRGEMEPPRIIYKQTEQYTLSQLNDPVTRLDRIECRGSLTEDGKTYTYLLSLPVARLAESAAISNRFLLLIGSGTMLLGALLFYLLTRRITDPIMRLNGLSQKMAGLDFSERFEERSGDEIETLGENLNHLSETLETTINDLKKANLALEQDVREKERENQLRKEFLASISHELKTPIALIQGYAEGLRDGMCEDEETRTRYSDTIMEEAERMNRLVRQLLSLNELESGKMVADISSFDLAELIRSMSDSYRLQNDDKKVRWELDLPEKLPVASDELLVEQILQNYLSNACHHVKENGLIRVSAGPEGQGAWIEVFNEGDLIPEEALELVWEKFYKVDKARTRSYGGSGIGLSVVKAIVELLGGSCSVENRENGVCFRARL